MGVCVCKYVPAAAVWAVAIPVKITIPPNPIPHVHLRGLHNCMPAIRLCSIFNVDACARVAESNTYILYVGCGRFGVHQK